MESLRNATQSRVGKAVMTVILGFIIVSFVFWGIADVFRGFSSNTVATVGGQTITVNAFGANFRRTVADYQQRAKTNLSAAQAHAMGIDRQVIDRMIADAALDDRAATLGLGVSDAAIAEAIVKDPALQDAKGQFSKERFDLALRNIGVTQAQFDADQRKSSLRRQIAAALASGVSPPKALVEALSQFDEQTRSIDYFVLPAASAAADVAAPTAEALKTYFEANKEKYRAPEFRALNLLALTATSLAKPSDVSDEDAKALYEKQKGGKFTKPESRKLQQIVFPSEAEAKDAADKIKGGASFDDIVKARNLQEADIDLGTGPKSNVFDKAIAEAGFALPEGGVSDIVKGQFGFALIRASAIVPAIVQPFAEVADAIKKDLAMARASKDIQNLHDKIEDARVAGKALPEAAKSLGLEPRTIAAIDKDGLDPTGAKIDLPDAGPVLRAAFASDVGADDAAIQTKDNGYIWFEVTKIDPARERPLDEVKDAVEKSWRADAASKALNAKAAELVKQLQGGADPAALAKSAGVDLKSAADVKRAGGADLPPGVTLALFSTPPGGANSAATDSGRYIFKITGEKTPPADLGADKYKSVIAKLSDSMANDVMTQYIQSLQQSLGVRIDERAMTTAEGG